MLGFEIFNYRDKLGRLGIYFLECGRLRAELIALHKIMRGINKVKAHSHLPKVAELRTGAHGFNVKVERFNDNQSGNFFTHWVVRAWNKLPEVVEMLQ